MIAEEEAACKFAEVPITTSFKPVSEVMNPTTPVISESITKKPVAMFPIGKKIGNICAGIFKPEATKNPEKPITILHSEIRKKL